ncbi:MAG: tripartite tricarboxylate transporter TctB family protein [Arenicella sp.]|nr:tripartite tricarboxylate transporter TctB family protein [Arenicella sp.]
MNNSFLMQKDKLGSLVLLGFALVFLISSYNLEIDPRYGELFNSGTLPKVLAWLLFACSAHQLFTSRGGDRFDSDIVKWNWPKVGLLIVLMSAYALAFSTMGFMLGSICFLVLGFRILGEQNYTKSILIAVAVVVPIWLLLVKVFDLFLDSGELYYLIVNIIGGAS